MVEHRQIQNIFPCLIHCPFRPVDLSLCAGQEILCEDLIPEAEIRAFQHQVFPVPQLPGIFRKLRFRLRFTPPAVLLQNLRVLADVIDGASDLRKIAVILPENEPALLVAAEPAFLSFHYLRSAVRASPWLLQIPWNSAWCLP